MTKDKITLEAVRQDLYRIIRWQLSLKSEWRFSFIVPITLIAITLCLALRNFWLGAVIFLFAAYHIFWYVIACREYFAKKRAIMHSFVKADVSVSVEQLSHIDEKTIYEPHMGHRRGYAFKTVKFYYFNSCVSWRIPKFYSHYEWSENFSFSTGGLDNISISGDEFFYICLQKFQDVAYIYPSKYFVLDSEFKNNNQPIR